MSTTPPGPTSTSSVSSSPVVLSYSVGGTITLPSRARMPSRTCSRRPVRKAPITGPVVRENGYSMMRGALSTPESSATVVLAG